MRSRMLGTSVAVALAVGLCAALATAAPRHLSTGAQWRANRRHATRVDKRDLRAVRLPAGSRRVRHLPPFDEPSAEELKQGPALDLVRRRLWVVPVRPPAVIHFVERTDRGRFHPPRGGEFGSGFFDEEPEPALPEIESNRRGRRGIVRSGTTVTVAALGHGRSAVQVQATAMPVRPRPSAERVPASVGRVRVEIKTWRGEKRSVLVRARARVSRLAGLADRLRINQEREPCEEVLVETGTPHPPLVHVSFESAAGAVLAEASQRAGTAGAVSCAAMRFSVHGKRMPALQNGARLLRAVLPERRRLARRAP